MKLRSGRVIEIVTSTNLDKPIQNDVPIKPIDSIPMEYEDMVKASMNKYVECKKRISEMTESQKDILRSVENTMFMLLLYRNAMDKDCIRSLGMEIYTLLTKV